MNHFISGIIKIMLLEGSVALLVVDLVAKDKFEKARATAAAILATLMVFAWANYGALRADNSVPYVLSVIALILGCAWVVEAGFGSKDTSAMKSFRAQTAALHKTKGPKIAALALCAAFTFGWLAEGHRTNSIVLVHPWEQFHFYLGAKYQREVGWFNLYKAAILADRESVNALRGLMTTRDLTTFNEVPLDVALSDAAQVRARFSDAAWASFKTDWQAFTAAFPMNWANVMNDHGNSNSPAWAIFAAPLARLVDVSRAGNSWLGWVDMVLMGIMWVFAWRTFGHRVAAVGLIGWAMMPNVFDYLAGSFLRWDWLFALGMATCFLKRKHYATAGAFFGYAVATKLFPIFFGVALAIRAFFEWRKSRQFSSEYRRFAIGTIAAGALAVGISTLMFGPDAWLEYAQRIQVAQVEKFYAIQYSLKTVFLQFAAGPWSLVSQGVFPSDIMQNRPEVDIKDFGLGFLAIRLVFTLLVAQLIRRADDVEAFTLGPLLVFTWLTVNMYYWNMFGLLFIGLTLRKDRHRSALALLIGVHAIMMFFYLYQHLNRGLFEGFAVAELLCALVIGVAATEFLDARSPPKTA